MKYPIILIIFSCFLFLSRTNPVHAKWDTNQAVVLNGTNAYLSCQAANCRSFFTPIGDLTIDTWLYFAEFTGTHDFAGVIALPGSYQLVLRSSSTSTDASPYLQLDYIFGGVSRQLQAPVKLAQQTWYQVSFQFAKTSPTNLNTKIFINGIEFASQNITGTNLTLDANTDTLFLGRSRANSPLYFPGQIDEVRLSSIARYSSHYTKPTGPYPLDNQVLALYHFEDNSGTSAVDASSKQSNLTLSNASWIDAANINQSLIANCSQTGNNTLTLGPDSDALLSYVTSKLLTAGQTLLLCDGTYQGAVAFNNQRFVDKDTGIGTPVTVKAIHDGQVTLEGLPSIRKSGMVQLFNTSGVNIEGIYAKNCYNPEAGQCSPLEIYYESSYISIKRFTGKQDDPTAVAAIFNLTGSDTADAHHLTLEDSASYGYGRLGIMVSTTTHHVTLRRFFNLAQGFQGANTWCVGIELYGGHDHLVENSLAFTQTTDPHPCHDTTNPANIVTYPFHGFIVPGTNQRLLGSIVKGNTGNSFYFTGCSQCLGQDLVSLKSQNVVNTHYGTVYNRGRYSSPITDNTLSQLTWINTNLSASGVAFSSDAQATDNVTVSNSYFSTAIPGTYALANHSAFPANFSHHDNRFSSQFTNPYFGLTAGTNEAKSDVQWNTDLYGDGAYLMASRTQLVNQGADSTPIGANVLYQYQDGVLTNIPLWPWPMEDRIKQETGISVTWANGGGFWKTLNGVYTAPPPPSPTPKPLDLNGDGLVDYLDFLYLISHFSQPYTIFDFNSLVKVL